jgi:hypothetical protein
MASMGLKKKRKIQKSFSHLVEHDKFKFGPTP